VKKYLHVLLAAVLLLSLMAPLTADATIDCGSCGRDEMNCPKYQFIALVRNIGCNKYIPLLNVIFFAGVITLIGVPVGGAVFVVRRFVRKRK
jgi:hypothetical protein